MGRTSGMRPSGCTIWVSSVVGSKGCGQARQLPTLPQSTSQVHPGRDAGDPAGFTNESVTAYTGAGNLRLQTTVIHHETRKCMQYQPERATLQPLLRCTDIQRNQGVVSAGLDNRRHGMAAAGRRISSPARHTGPHHHSQERYPTLGKRERKQNRSRGLDVVDRRIALRRWLGGSRSRVQTTKTM